MQEMQSNQKKKKVRTDTVSVSWTLNTLHWRDVGKQQPNISQVLAK